MQSIMVTGGAGFIGSNFVRHWQKQHPADKVIIVDSLTYAGNRDSLDGVLCDLCELCEVSINDTETIANLIREHDIKKIIHFAAESHVDRSIVGPDVFITTNVNGTFSLLQAAKSVWLDEGDTPVAHRFHHVSTDEVYGSLTLTDEPFSETTPYAPNSPYSASKAASDFLVRSYHHTYGMNITISNCSNNYGPYHLPEKLIPLVITNILNGKALPIYGTGKNIRDWLHVQDHARAIELIVDKGENGRTYNVGGNTEVDNIAIVSMICELVDQLYESDKALFETFPNYLYPNGTASINLIKHVEDRAGHDFRYAIDASRIQSELGFSPEVVFDEGLMSTIKWYLANEYWWRGKVVS